MIKKTNRGFQFSSGRSFYANGYIGIMEEADQSLSIAQGYDGRIDLEGKGGQYVEPGENDPPLTDVEKEELADYMISLWTRFKQ